MATKQKSNGVPYSRLYIVSGFCFIAGLFIGSVLTDFSTSPSNSTQNQNTQIVSSQSANVNAHIAELKSQIAIEPSNVELVIHLGNLYYDSKMFPEAIETYEKALRLAPKNPNVMTDLGTSYRLTKNPEKAIEKYNLAIAMNPRHENARLNKGIVLYYDLQNKEEAIKAWKALLAINPNAKTSSGIKVSEFVEQISN